jgi:hypothetical protein
VSRTSSQNRELQTDLENGTNKIKLMKFATIEVTAPKHNPSDKFTGYDKKIVSEYFIPDKLRSLNDESSFRGA